jgi:hypothetical protein
MTETSNQKRSGPPKDRWDKFQILSSGGLVPLVIAGAGYYYSESQQESENRVKYVEIAVQQLRAEPTRETAALRSWAVELLNKNSPIKLSAEAKAQLLSQPFAKGVELSARGNSVTSGSATGTLSSEKNAP